MAPIYVCIPSENQTLFKNTCTVMIRFSTWCTYFLSVPQGREGAYLGQGACLVFEKQPNYQNKMFIRYVKKEQQQKLQK